MAKQFQLLKQDATCPGMDSVPVDVSGGNVTPTEPFRAIRASGAGNIVVDTMLTASRTIAITAGETRAIYVLKVYQTGTTATGIEGIV